MMDAQSPIGREQVQAFVEDLLLEDAWARLKPQDRRAIERIARRLRGVRNANEAAEETLSLGDRLADKIAAIGGSWSFILSFLAFLVVWAATNLLLPTGSRFDPYPFIFLNLLLSMLAAQQAPVIMMSQNRQEKNDRLAAQLDYEVNAKAEAEIAALAEKVDTLLERSDSAGAAYSPLSSRKAR